MAKRRPLPYHASFLIDSAVMSLEMARKNLKPLLDKNDLETVVRTGKSLDEIAQAVSNLKEISKEKVERP